MPPDSQGMCSHTLESCEGLVGMILPVTAASDFTVWVQDTCSISQLQAFRRLACPVKPHPLNVAPGSQLCANSGPRAGGGREGLESTPGSHSGDCTTSSTGRPEAGICSPEQVWQPAAAHAGWRQAGCPASGTGQRLPACFLTGEKLS